MAICDEKIFTTCFTYESEKTFQSQYFKPKPRLGHYQPATTKTDDLKVPPSKRLAIISLVLASLSVVPPIIVIGPILAIIAVICGHIALKRARKHPQTYTGRSYAISGLIIGYSVLVFFGLAFGSALNAAEKMAEEINCINNLTMVGVSTTIWIGDHDDVYPSSFFELSNILESPKFLVCPAAPHSMKRGATNWNSPQVSYYLLTPHGSNLAPTTVIAVCPIHGLELWADGSVEKAKK